MNYNFQLSLEEYPYPNLMAEILESGYSFSTLGNHMGLGMYKEQNDPEIWNKLLGYKEIYATEAIGLARLFGVKMEYLMSHKLNMLEGKSFAYWRWSDWNKKRERESREYKMRAEIERKLKEKPFLLEIVLKIANMSEKEANRIWKKIERDHSAA